LSREKVNCLIACFSLSAFLRIFPIFNIILFAGLSTLHAQNIFYIRAAPKTSP
jgi:hypothetical protein